MIELGYDERERKNYAIALQQALLTCEEAEEKYNDKLFIVTRCHEFSHPKTETCTKDSFLQYPLYCNCKSDINEVSKGEHD